MIEEDTFKWWNSCWSDWRIVVFIKDNRKRAKK